MSYNDDGIEVIEDHELYRDTIATVDEKGKRKWIYAKKPSGRFYNARVAVGLLLLAVLFGMPWIKIDGEPFFMINIIERQFILFGTVFTTADFYIFGLMMVTFIVFIALFTVVFGRLFCGWICPQTVFMELVFRRIEYWIEGDAPQQRKLNAAPWTGNKAFKKTLKHTVFFLVSMIVANNFLAYIIGIDEVIKIITEPISIHFGGFVSMIGFSFAFYFIFAWMREQVCVAICPYGRMQGVLLSKDSIAVSYDYVRGEPRGKIKKTDTTTSAGAGDCVDCNLCVQVCPTGIDIRNGSQLECTNCTACIDVCDSVMDKIHKPKGLIRYASHDNIAKGLKFRFTTRMFAYSGVLVILMTVISLLLFTRAAVSTVVLRTPGMLYQEVDSTHYGNVYNYEIMNKTSRNLPVTLRLVTPGGTLKMIGHDTIKVPKQDIAKGTLMINMETSALQGYKTKLRIEVYSEGKKIDYCTTTFLGPM